MHPLRLFYRAETGNGPPGGAASCWLCGEPCPEDGAAVGDVVRSTFTDAARARLGGSSTVVCPACEFYFDFKIKRPGGKRAMGLFTKQILVTPDDWWEWGREDMAEDLMRWAEGGLPAPTVVAVNYSKRKHVLPWARVTPAGSRKPWIRTDGGAEFRLSSGFPDLLAVCGYLWSEGHHKRDVGRGRLTSYSLRGANRPDMQVRARRYLRRWTDDPHLELATYCLTEENRDGHARRVGAVLSGADGTAAAGGDAPVDPQRRREPELQEPVPKAVVGDSGDESEAVRQDERGPHAVEQLSLDAPPGADRAE